MFNGNPLFFNITTNEIIYRSFIVFYGLIFPSYVFMFMIPKKRKDIPLNKYNLFIWITAILIALPFYAIGFLIVKCHLEICMLLGLAVVLFSRNLLRTKIPL